MVRLQREHAWEKVLLLLEAINKPGVSHPTPALSKDT